MKNDQGDQLLRYSVEPVVPQSVEKMMESSNPYHPDQTTPAAPPQSGFRTVSVRRIDVLSAAAMAGAICALGGLVAGIFIALVSVVGGAAGGDAEAALGGAIGGLGAIIIIPLLYGIGGFIAGLIGSLIYNLVASFLGGIKMDLEL